MNTSAKISFKGIRAAIIDLDGTMVDTAPDFQVAINRMREEIHLAPLTLETITDFVGKGSENLMRRVLGVDFEASEVERRFELALQRYQHHYLQINGNHSELYAGVYEGLLAMKKGGVRLACVTNKPIAFARPLLEKKGLIDSFEVIYGGDSLAHKNPILCPCLPSATILICSLTKSSLLEIPQTTPRPPGLRDAAF